MRILWTRGAQADLLEVFGYIAEEDIKAAARLRDKIKRAVITLADHPKIGRTIPEFNNPILRELIVPPYRILYLIKETEVHILGLVHSRMLMRGYDDGVPREG